MKKILGTEVLNRFTVYLAQPDLLYSTKKIGNIFHLCAQKFTSIFFTEIYIRLYRQKSLHWH